MKRLSIGLLLLAILLFWNAQVVIAQFSEAGVEKFRVAVAAPDFTLKELSGGKVSLNDLKGKVVLINFFAPY